MGLLQEINDSIKALESMISIKNSEDKSNVGLQSKNIPTKRVLPKMAEAVTIHSENIAPKSEVINNTIKHPSLVDYEQKSTSSIFVPVELPEIKSKTIFSKTDREKQKIFDSEIIFSDLIDIKFNSYLCANRFYRNKALLNYFTKNKTNHIRNYIRLKQASIERKLSELNSIIFKNLIGIIERKEKSAEIMKEFKKTVYPFAKQNQNYEEVLISTCTFSNDLNDRPKIQKTKIYECIESSSLTDYPVKKRSRQNLLDSNSTENECENNNSRVLVQKSKNLDEEKKDISELNLTEDELKKIFINNEAVLLECIINNLGESQCENLLDSYKQLRDKLNEKIIDSLEIPKSEMKQNLSLRIKESDNVISHLNENVDKNYEHIFEEILKNLAEGNLECDVRFLKMINKTIKKFGVYDDPTVCKMTVQFVLCKRYLEDYIKIKEIVRKHAKCNL